jgi:fructose-1,6-bisphosphatase/sedoheptulose 1,7-bisphosphatase-like protein
VPSAMGVKDLNKVFHIEDLARGNVMFCATGVTTGNFLRGVQFKPWGAMTHSIVMRSESGTIRHIMAEHHFDKKAPVLIFRRILYGPCQSCIDF